MTTPTPLFPDGLPDLPAGVYRHYKGGFYQVLGYARDSTNRATPRVVVVYVGLQVPGLQLPGDETTRMRMKVRDAEEFHQFVHEDGTVCDYRGWSRRWPPAYCDRHDTGMALRFSYVDVEVPRAHH